MRRLARAVVRHPWLVVLAWLAGGAAIVVAGPSYGSVRQTGIDLPASSESARADALQTAKFGRGDDRPTATVVTERPADAPALRRWLSAAPDVAGADQPVPSADGRAALVRVTFDRGGPDLDRGVAAIEDHLAGTPAAITGGPAFDHDLNADTLNGGGSSASGLSPLRLLTLLLVLVVLALVYRAPLAAVTPLVCIGAVIAISPHVIAAGAWWLGLPVGNFSLPFTFAVTLGAGTNYGLFLISRYRELLGRGLAPRDALEEALVRVGAAITSSAATVVAGTAVMVLATFGLFRTMGPAISISVALMLLAGLTLLPALMSISGRAFLWPRNPRSGRPQAAERGAWRRVGEAVTRRPALAAAAALVALLPAAVYGVTVRPSFSILDALPDSVQSAHGYRLLEAHYPDGVGSLTLLVQPASEVDAVRRAVTGTPGVTAVGEPQVSPDGSTARLRVGVRPAPDSVEAIATADAVDRAARQTDRRATVLAGGQPVSTRDLRDLLVHDLVLIAALVGLAIFAVLALLLRSVVAPLYLPLTVALSTAVAVGAVALVYRETAGIGLYWTAPVFAFVFLVALGEDFNILLVSRLRQEVAWHGPAEGVARAVGATGGVITSCGVVFAVGFLLLVRNPVYLVQEIGVAVVVGVLLDTFLVRPVLAPALAILLGSARRWAPAGAARAERAYDPAG
jgi:RND superfamily putative drug exporter